MVPGASSMPGVGKFKSKTPFIQPVHKIIPPNESTKLVYIFVDNQGPWTTDRGY